MSVNTENSMTRQDTTRLYDKLEEIVKSIGLLQTSIALINQSNESREQQMLSLGTRLGSLEEAQRRNDLFRANLRGKYAVVGAIGAFLIGLVSALTNDFLKLHFLAEVPVTTVFHAMINNS